MGSRRRGSWVVPALFVAVALATGTRVVTGIDHAVWHSTTRAWLGVSCDVLRMGIAIAFALFTVGRAAPRRPARQPIAFLACAVAIGTAAMTADPPAGTPNLLVMAGELVAVAGFAWMLSAVMILGRCFGVLPEARGLVTRGPYRVVRHPVYLGEIGACAGLVVAAPTAANGAALAAFLLAQATRMMLEERALRAAFPDYEAYAHEVPRIVPSARKYAAAARGSASTSSITSDDQPNSTAPIPAPVYGS
jgi:protein-S-isoprenylcysteine O-methyltransferase Ste14